jgi:hypothetical protein
MINELPARSSNLTEQQQREATAAVYGASMSPNTTELTYEERIRMRRMLDALDQKEGSALKEFDLNKPPVPPYVYREYPFILYHHQSKQAKAAHNHEQRQKMLAEGWSENPIAIETPAVELTVSERMQAEELDRQLKMPREQLEAEQSAEHMAAMRARIAELEAQVGVNVTTEPAETETEKSQRKRSK